MRQIPATLALLILPAVAWPQSGASRVAPAPDSAKTASVMIVGVSHLVSRRDVHNAVFEDSPLSPKRQAEIEDLVSRLARFHPTKVLVERDMGDTAVTAQYRRYVAGEFTLAANEVYQFGFKLAARAGDSAIYPIDADGPPLFDEKSDSGTEIVQFLKAHFADVSTPAFASYLARSDSLQRHGTYLQLLRYLNTDAAIRANASVYSVLDGMGQDVHHAGSAYVSQWYARNCYIFANLLTAVAPGDRVVLIMGQGHEYLLRELVRLNPTLVPVDPLTYLQSTNCHPLVITPVQAAGSPNTRTISTESGKMYVSKTPLVDQRHVVGAYVNVTEGQVVLNVNLDADGGATLARFTTAHVGSTIAFFYDGRLVRAARILDPLRNGNFLIGPLDRRQADRLAASINQSVASCVAGQQGD